MNRGLTGRRANRPAQKDNGVHDLPYGSMPTAQCVTPPATVTHTTTLQQ